MFRELPFILWSIGDIEVYEGIDSELIEHVGEFCKICKVKFKKRIKVDFMFSKTLK